MNTNRFVLDSFAVLAFVQQEKKHEWLKDLLERASDSHVELHMSIINLAEVQYRLLRRLGKDSPALAALESLPVKIASADEFVPSVVRLKAHYPISLADCFAAALAMSLDCALITGDPEFRKLESILSVEWL